MGKRTCLGAEQTHSFWCAPFPSSAQRSPSFRRNPTTDRRHRCLILQGLTILPVCLAALFVASAVIEAFDDDLDLWSVGAEDISVPSDDPPTTGGLHLWARSGLSAAYCFVIATGPCLVLQHRARSALPTDSLSSALAYTMAEPGWQNLWVAPALGHSCLRVRGVLQA
jgi:hypothetical protein